MESDDIDLNKFVVQYMESIGDDESQGDFMHNGQTIDHDKEFLSTIDKERKNDDDVDENVGSNDDDDDDDGIEREVLNKSEESKDKSSLNDSFNDYLEPLTNDRDFVTRLWQNYEKIIHDFLKTKEPESHQTLKSTVKGKSEERGVVRKSSLKNYLILSNYYRNKYNVSSCIGTPSMNVSAGKKREITPLLLKSNSKCINNEILQDEVGSYYHSNTGYVNGIGMLTPPSGYQRTQYVISNSRVSQSLPQTYQNIAGYTLNSSNHPSINLEQPISNNEGLINRRNPMNSNIYYPSGDVVDTLKDEKDSDNDEVFIDEISNDSFSVQAQDILFDEKVESWKSKLFDEKSSNSFVWDSSVKSCLHDVFNIKDFKQFQSETINAALSKKDIVLVLPTGAGKSLTYQLPSLLDKGVTVVISPLTSLIHDQVMQMDKILPVGTAVYLPSSMSSGSKKGVTEILKVLNDVAIEGSKNKERRDKNIFEENLKLLKSQFKDSKRLGVSVIEIDSEEDDLKIQKPAKLKQVVSPNIKMLYITPEKLVQSTELQKALKNLYDSGLLTRFVIDEAHCISKYGFDFRKDYTNLNIIRKMFPNIPLTAVTATCTPGVRNDIVRELGMNTKGETVLFYGEFNRGNLIYEVRKKKSSTKQNAKDVSNFIKKNYSKESGIVYCCSLTEVQSMYEALSELGHVVRPYNSLLTIANRKKYHEQWLKGSVKIIVATSAFGMGINKKDVRFVIHHSLPKTMEDYYQESGRAGRDGRDSHCLLYYSYTDKSRQQALIVSSDKQFDSRIIKNKLFELNKIGNFCTEPITCRRQIILNHFGEIDFERDDCNEKCDNCIKFEESEIERIDLTDQVKGLLSIIRSIQQKQYTMNHILGVFKGSKTKKIKEAGQHNLKGHGSGKKLDKDFAERIANRLLLEGYFYEEISFNSFGGILSYIYANKKKIDNFTNSDEKYYIEVFSSKKNKSKGKKRKIETLSEKQPKKRKVQNESTSQSRLTETTHISESKDTEMNDPLDLS